jgi:hypothetical protein
MIIAAFPCFDLQSTLMPRQVTNLATKVKKGTIEAGRTERRIGRDQFSDIQKNPSGCGLLLHEGDDG